MQRILAACAVATILGGCIERFPDIAYAAASTCPAETPFPCPACGICCDSAHPYCTATCQCSATAAASDATGGGSDVGSDVGSAGSDAITVQDTTGGGGKDTLVVQDITGSGDSGGGGMEINITPGDAGPAANELACIKANCGSLYATCAAMADCNGALLCIFKCGANDTGCTDACMTGLSTPASNALIGLANCAATSCSSCGDGNCSGAETAANCAADCGFTGVGATIIACLQTACSSAVNACLAESSCTAALHCAVDKCAGSVTCISMSCIPFSTTGSGLFMPVMSCASQYCGAI